MERAHTKGSRMLLLGGNAAQGYEEPYERGRHPRLNPKLPPRTHITIISSESFIHNSISYIHSIIELHEVRRSNSQVM